MTRQSVSVLLGVVFATLSSAQVVTQLTDTTAPRFGWPRLTDDGTAVFAVSTADPVGKNPRHRWHVFRFDLTTGGVEQVTRFSQGVVRESPYNLVYAGPAVSDDGQRLAFVSRENLTGANSDLRPELFVMNADGSGLTQLTTGTGVGEIGHVAIAGDGSRVTFDADFDYMGDNPTGQPRVYVVDADGSNFLPLSGGSQGRLPFISDDGERVVFYGEVFPSRVLAVEASGANLRYLVASASWPTAISGDGSTVLYLASGDTCPDPATAQVGVVDWDGSNGGSLTCIETGATTYGSAFVAEVTDDGQTIFYTGEGVDGAVVRLQRDGSGATPIVPPMLCPRVGVAGSEARIAFTCTDAVSEENLELFTAGADGTNEEQLTDTLAGGGHSWQPVISADAGRVTFLSNANPLGEQPHPGLQLYSVSTGGTGMERLTSLSLTPPPSFLGTDVVDSVAASADGSIAVFHDGEAGPLYIVETDSRQVIEVPGVFFTPNVDDDGDRIVAVSTGGLGTIYEIAPDGSTTTALVEGQHPRLDGAGAQMVYQRGGLVYSMALATLSEKVIGPGSTPDISRAGDRVVFSRDGEIFTKTDAGIEQLTFTPDVGKAHPAISGDGQWVYYTVDVPDASLPGDSDIERVHTTSLVVERVGGLLPCRLGGLVSEHPLSSPPGVVARVSPGQDGSLAVFHAGADCSGHNGDGSLEVYLIDRSTPPTLRLGPPQPTLLTWEAGSGPYLYDVIRGDLTALGFDGPAIDLGSVTCIENDSVDNATLAAEDADLPAAGQAYFYLMRGLPGGDYGGSTTGAPRAPALGDCPD